VLLDGLDEVIEESRRKFVAEQASAFIREAVLNGNCVLLTSRIYGYRAAPLSVNLPHITVLDFRREEIEMFARQWSRAMATWDAQGCETPQTELSAQAEERRLLEGIRSNPGVERLAANPLLLTMLALLQRQVGALPQRRIQLYDLYIYALVQNWEENRSRGVRLKAPKRIDTLEAENILIPLALWLQQNKPSGTATRTELLRQITCIFLREAGYNPDATDIPAIVCADAERRAENFLADMRQFSGLLVECGQNAFGFRHLTFQEYFAGRALARMDADKRWELLKPNLHAGRWREAVLLAAARLGVTENRGDQATALVERIFDADSDYEPALHRDLFLAADCATDDIGVSLPVLRRIVSGLAVLATSRVPTLAISGVRNLSKLGLLRAGDRPRLPEALLALVPALDAITQQTRGALLESIFPVWSESAELTEKAKEAIVEEVARAEYWYDIRQYQDMAPYLRASTALRDAVAAKLADEASNVRGAAIHAVSRLLAGDAELRGAVAAKLADENQYVRGAAIRGLSPLAVDDAGLRYNLMPVLASICRETP